MMNVPKITVELKEGLKGTKAKRILRVIASPLALREQTKKDLDSTVKMGILEDVSGKANHDCCLDVGRISSSGEKCKVNHSIQYLRGKAVLGS